MQPAKRALLKVFLKSTCSTRCRFIDGGLDSCGTLLALSAITDGLALGAEEQLLEVTMVECVAAEPVRVALYYSNICGVITHSPAPTLIHPAVRPLMITTHNAFGAASELYSKNCNLVVYNNNCSTLFRGCRCTAAIFRTIQHAINEGCITKMTVHMLVASAGTGRAVCMQSTHVVAAFQRDPRWTAQQDEVFKTSNSINIRLQDFDAAWLESVIAPNIIVPKSLLIIISIGGNVNMFLTPKREVAIKVGVENSIKPIYDFFYRYIEALL